jgi:hypothetical protein
MRHLLTAALAALMAATFFFVHDWAFITLSGPHLGGWSVTALIALIAMVGTGLLLGVLVSARNISPLASALPGAVLLGWSALLIFGPSKLYKVSSPAPGVLGAGFSQVLLYGVAAVLGAAMIGPALVPSRWRRGSGDGALAATARAATARAAGRARVPGSIAFAAAVAIVLFFADGWAIQTITGRVAPGEGLVSAHNVAAFGLLAATGLLLGALLALQRVSPLAGGLPGVVLIAWSALAAFDHGDALRLVPLQHHSFGQGFTDMLLEGLAAVLGAVLIAPLLIPLASRLRWRGAASEAVPAGDPTAAEVTG